MVALSAAVFVPLKYLYPSRMPSFRRSTNAAAGVWLVVLAAALAFPAAAWRQAALQVSLLFPAYYLVMSFVLGGRLRRAH